MNQPCPLPPYREETTTRTYGLTLLLFGVLGLAGDSFVMTLALAEPYPGAEIGLLIGVPIAAAFGYCVFLAVNHLRKPRQAWVEINGDTLSWRDGAQLGPTVEARYPLAQIRAIASNEVEYLLLKDGTTASLPIVGIRRMKTFRAELKTRAPHVVFQRWDGQIEPL